MKRPTTSLRMVLLLAAAAYGFMFAMEYTKRWCPAGTDPEAMPHCFMQPYFGVRPSEPLPKFEELRFYRMT